MDLLLLVDGSSYLYRAFHALPDLRNKAGEPTGAIYGMVSMLRRLRQDVAAQYSAVIFDAPGKTFRDDWYPQYKATRSAMPEDLARQIVPIHAVVAALGWPILMIDGIEADDVIGTLAKRATGAGTEDARVHRRQGPGAAGRRPRHAGQHDESSANQWPCVRLERRRRGARHRRREGQVRRRARSHRRLPDAGRRHGRQRAGRGQGRPEDRGEVARAVRLARRHRRTQRGDQGRGRRQPAESPRLAADGPQAGDGEDRLPARRSTGHRDDAGAARRGPQRAARAVRPLRLQDVAEGSVAGRRRGRCRRRDRRREDERRGRRDLAAGRARRRPAARVRSDPHGGVARRLARAHRRRRAHGLRHRDHVARSDARASWSGCRSRSSPVVRRTCR